jgi:hypothetical protein
MKGSSIGIKIIFINALVLTILIPMKVFAERPFYITFKPGIYSPESTGLDTGLNVELAFGYRFNRNIAAEFGVGGFNTQKEVTGVAGTFAIRENCTYEVYPLTLTLKAIVPYKRWEFFGLGGGGVYFVFGPYNLNGDYNGYYDFDPHNDTVWGAYLGGGLHYYITPSDRTPRVFVGVEGKYLWTGKAKLNGEEYGIPLDASFKLNGIIATAVIGVSF